MTKTDKSKKTILVLGMHRSGTSVLSSILHNMGVKMGSTEDIERMEYDNALGFYENYEIALLNDQILEALGAAWDNIPDEEFDFNIKNLKGFKTKAELLIDRLYKGQDKYVGIKEPRMTVLAGFWEEFIKKPTYIFVFRNPIDVAKSIEKRGTTSYEKALEQWAVYNKKALSYLTGKDFLILKYEDILKNPAGSVALISKYIGVKSDVKSSQKFLSGIEPGIQHHSASDEEVLNSKKMPGKVVETYKKLKDVYKSQQTAAKAEKAAFKIDYRQQLVYAQERIKKIDKLMMKYRTEAVFLNKKNVEQSETMEQHRDIIADLNRRLCSAEEQLNKIRGSRAYKFYSRIRRILIKLKIKSA